VWSLVPGPRDSAWLVCSSSFGPSEWRKRLLE
jgi:hypothetical protein